uniref:cell wall protein DAN4-like n=1 Tax=Oncorhynchus gorbuscha TaxID=8017 RepID=UPI001EAF28B2
CLGAGDKLQVDPTPPLQTSPHPADQRGVRKGRCLSYETNNVASGSSDVPNDTTASAHPIHPLAGLLLVDEEPLSVGQPDGRAVSEGVGLKEQPAFSSILTLLADKHPLSLVRSKTSPTITKDNNQTSLWPSVAPFSSSSSSVEPSRDLSDSSETAMDELTVGTSIETGVHFPKDNETRLSQTGNLTLGDRPALTTSQVSPLTPREDTTTASLQLTTVTTTTIASTTTQPITESPTTTTTRRTTTAPASRRTLPPPIPKTKPRGTTTPFPFTTTTEAPPRQCNVTEKIWVKTILTIHVRRNRLDSIQRQNLRRGLTQALSRALNDTTAQAQ